ncbi:MAG TPA: DNA cytosine methyltransferase [Polyangia bacterium]|jgi:DNA (cytosine-5)-methyltransferase 1
MGRKPRVVSLYSGAGGLDYGFEAAGFETVVALEIDHNCCETLRRNRPWPVIERSVFEVPSEEILEVGGVRRGEIDVLVGGPPCQPFSKAGYWARGDARRLADPRSDTLGAYLRVVEDLRPQTFLLENVEGLSYSEKDEGLGLILNRIKDINRRTRSNYRPHFQVVRAAEFGVPQQRERFVLVASREGDAFSFPQGTHSAADPRNGQLSKPATEPFRTAWDALADLQPAPDEDLAVRGKWADLLPSVPEGENYLWHTDRGGGMPLFGWRRRYWSFLLKLAKNRPSWTIQAQPGPAIGPFHWSSRRLGERELCRLQTFPDDVRIFGTHASIQKQLGNAVPSLLAEVLARAIRSQFLGGRRPTGLPLLLPPRRGSMPAPEVPAKVPRKFHALRGDHAAHDGTGRGFRAVTWSPIASVG